MSKKVSEMTEEERKRVREVERKRRAAKKAGSKLLAKTAEKKAPAPKKCDKKVVLDGKIIGYYADHFDCAGYVLFPIAGGKYRLGDYDFTNYSNSGRVNRGHVDIVPRPDTDTNPYHDEPRFHSQEEYDDYIKWRD